MAVDTPWYEDVGRFLTGGVDPNTVQSLMNNVKPPDQNAYKIPGLEDYVGQQQGFGGEVGGLNADLNGATAGQRGQNQQLQGYFQQQAMGQGGPTAADQLLNNAQGAAARNLQSASVSAGGNNPALALRQMLGAQSAVQGNIAGQSAQQKLQEQQQYAALAQRGGQDLYQQDFQREQQNYANKMANVQARADIANNIFGANRSQTSLNVDREKNQQAFQMWQYEQQQQMERDRARNAAVLPQLAIQGGMTALGGFGGGYLASLGGQAAGSAARGAVQGFSTPQGPASGSDINNAYGGGTFRENGTPGGTGGFR